MSKFAVCIHTAANSFALWIITNAETASEAVDKIRSEYTVHDVAGVYQEAMLGGYRENIEKKLEHNCHDCKYEDRIPNIYPCRYRAKAERDAPPSKWEPKEG